MSPEQSQAHVQAHELMRAGRHAQALPLARKAVAGLSRCTPAQGLLAAILLNLGQDREALSVIEAASALPEADAAGCDTLAHACLRLDRPVEANALYRRAADLAPHAAGAWYNLAASERGLGHLEAAEAACDRAIACDPAHYSSYLLRSELRVQKPEANHVESLRAVLATLPSGAPPRVPLGYALAKELDDIGAYDEAFGWFAEAAAVRRRHLAYDVATDEHKLARIAQVFDPLIPTTPRKDRAKFVFIIGLPRSGTTLLERVLSNLPGVATNGETDNFARALLSATPPGSEDIFARAARADPALVGAAYARLAERRDAETVIEKLPMNYLYLGAIRQALPDAALLVLRRPALDSCFAMFRTLFGEAYPFSYDFNDLARYYAAYDRLMDHWRDRLGGALHEVDYASLVTEPETTSAAAAAHCGLPWQDKATAIETNRAASFTASAAQVRRPIYRTSLDRIGHYRDQLEPLAKALRTHGIGV